MSLYIWFMCKNDYNVWEDLVNSFCVPNQEELWLVCFFCMVVKCQFSRVFIFLNELPYVLLHDLSLLREKRRESLTGMKVFSMFCWLQKSISTAFQHCEIWLNPPNLSQLWSICILQVWHHGQWFPSWLSKVLRCF